MIRLHRGPEPEFLAGNRTAWTERFNQVPPPRDWATSGQKHQLRDALAPLSREKCTFCESLLGVTAFPEIEHYWPKSRYPGRVFEWDNLFLACSLCNRAKGNQDHNGALIKPDAEDPEPLLWLNLDSGKLEPGEGLPPELTERVHETIRICNLNRGGLCQARIKQAELARSTLARLGREGTDPTPETRLEKKSLLSPEQQYKFVIRFEFDRTGNTALAVEDRETFAAAH